MSYAADQGIFQLQSRAFSVIRASYSLEKDVTLICCLSRYVVRYWKVVERPVFLVFRKVQSFLSLCDYQ